MVEYEKLKNIGNVENIIFCGDLHLSRYSPRARIDNYEASIFGKLEQIINISNKNKLLAVFTGDVFHKPVEKLIFLNKVIDIFKKFRITPVCIYGNHDVISANIESDNILYTLENAGLIKIIKDSQLEYRVSLNNGLKIGLGGTPCKKKIPQNISVDIKNDIQALTSDVEEKSFFLQERVKNLNAETQLHKDFKQENNLDYVCWITHHNLFIDQSSKVATFESMVLRNIIGVDLVVNGEIHKRMPFVKVGNTMYANIGSIARTRLNGKNDDPKCWVLDFSKKSIDLSPVDIDYLPAEKVFISDIKIDNYHKNDITQEGKSSFIENIKSDKEHGDDMGADRTKEALIEANRQGIISKQAFDYMIDLVNSTDKGE